MLKFIKVTPTGGDETAGYDVILDKDYTVQTLIDEILLNKNEWGKISIDGYDSCEYKKGELLSQLGNNTLTKSVDKVTASGGWSRMDYFVTISKSN